jgi:hypothetical protein
VSPAATQSSTPPRGHSTPSPRATHRAASGPAASSEAAAPYAASSEPGRADARPSAALLAFAGTELLLISELVDRLEHLEDNLGISWFNLLVAAVLATLIVRALALIGDSALNMAERRIGHRPGSRYLTPLLATAGGAAFLGILAAHLSHTLALDGWVGLGGAGLLLIAAVHRHAAA